MKGRPSLLGALHVRSIAFFGGPGRSRSRRMPSANTGGTLFFA